MAELIGLKCRNCGANLSQTDIMKDDREMIRCAHCEAFYLLERPQEEQASEAEPAKTWKRPEVYKKPIVRMPRGYSVERKDDRICIAHRWLDAWAYVALVGAIALVFGAVIWFVARAEGAGDPALYPFDVVAVLLPIALLYWAVAHLVNRTEIVAEAKTLTVTHKPLPWPGNFKLFTATPQQIYARRRAARTQEGTQVYVSYEVKLIRLSGRRATLIRGLTSLDQAVFVEQQLEGFLGIEDKRVVGETKIRVRSKKHQRRRAT